MTIKAAIISADQSPGVEAKPAPQPYRRAPAYLIRRLHMICNAMVAEEFEDEDMPVSQWAVLTIIENHPEIDQSRLAEVISFDKTNTGRLVDQLEAKGLVERRPMIQIGGYGCFAARRLGKRSENGYVRELSLRKKGCCRASSRQIVNSSSI